MSKVHGKGAVVKIDDLSGSLGDISSAIIASKFAPKVDRPNTTCFGARGVRREVIGLVDNDVIPVNGFYTRVAGTKIHGKGAAVLMNQFDMSPHFNSATVRNNIQLDNTNTFGDPAVERDVPGLLDSDADLSGFYDPAASGSWPTVRAALAATSALVSLAPEGWAIGNMVEMGKGAFESTDVPLDVDKVIPISAKVSGEDAWDLGVCLHPLQAEVAAANYTGVDETSVSTALGGVGQLHVTAFVSGTATVKIQDSADNSVFADILTFTNVTAVGSERVETAPTATIRRYVRAITTGTFSITFEVSFARRGFTNGAVGTYRHFRGLIGQANSCTFQLGPSGSAVSAERITGESRMRSLELSVSNEEVVKFAGELLVTGAVTYDTF